MLLLSPKLVAVSSLTWCLSAVISGRKRLYRKSQNACDFILAPTKAHRTEDFHPPEPVGCGHTLNPGNDTLNHK